MEAAAQKLGISLEELMAALQSSSTNTNGIHKTDFAAAASKLNVSEESLKSAMGIA